MSEIQVDFGEGPITVDRVVGLWIDPDVFGESWMVSGMNPACFNYAVRAASKSLPVDDKVWYVKIGGFGYLVHESEFLEGLPTRDREMS